MLRDLAAEVLYASGITRPSRIARGRLVVATFHRVLPAAQRDQYPFSGLVVTPEELEWFVRFFRVHFDCGTLSDSIRKWKEPDSSNRPPLAITFDDGTLDNFLHARSVLDRLQTRATFFVTSQGTDLDQTLWHDRIGYALLRLSQGRDERLRDLLAELELPAAWRALPSQRLASTVVERAKALAPTRLDEWLARIEDRAGEDPRPSWDGMMSWAQLSELARGGHEIGSHTISHRVLTACSMDEARLEVTESRRILQKQLDLPIESFCYPNGNHDEYTIAVSQSAGYSNAVTTEWGMNEPGASLYALRRCDMVTQHSTNRSGTLSESRIAWRMSGLHPGLR